MNLKLTTQMMKHSMEIGDYLNEIVIAGGGVVGALTAWKQGQKRLRQVT